MPPVIAAVTAIAASPIGSFLLRLGVSFVIGRMQQKRMEKKMRQAKAEAAKVLINASSNSESIGVAYGKTRVGGIRAFVESTNGSGDESASTHLNMVFILSEGYIEEIQELWFDDNKVWDVANANPTWDGHLLDFDNAPDTDYRSILQAAGTQIVFNHGTDDQTVDTTFQDSVGSDIWTNDHRLRGLTYLSLILKANADAYKGGLPLITAVIQGRHMQDVSAITEGDTTRTTYLSGADANPVDVLYDYLTNPRYGKGLDHTAQNPSDIDANYQAGLHIDIASFQQARTDIGNTFKINGVINTANTVYDNVGEILESMNGILVFQNGKYKLKIKKQNESVRKTFTYADIIGAVAYTEPGKESRFNKVKAFFRNKEAGTDYNDDMVVVENATYLTEDNDQILEGQTRLDLIDDETLVNTLATYLMDASRYNSIIQFEAPHTTLKLECGDIIAMQLDDFGWTAGNEREFRIAQMSITAEDTIEFVCEEYNSSIEIIS